MLLLVLGSLDTSIMVPCSMSGFKVQGVSSTWTHFKHFFSSTADVLGSQTSMKFLPKTGFYNLVWLSVSEMFPKVVENVLFQSCMKPLLVSLG